MKSIVRKSLLLATLAAVSAQAERNLPLYTVDSSGNPIADPYTSRNLDMNDSGRFIYAAGPEQNVRATHGTTTGFAIAVTDMLFKSTTYIASPEFSALIEDEPNIDVSPDGRYVVLRPSFGRAGNYTSAAAPLYVYDMVAATLAPVIKSHDGSPLTGCTNSWSLHNWSRSSFAYWQNEVVYFSDCSNIVEGDTNGVSDIFVYDIATGTNTLLTQVINTDGSLSQADGESVSPEVDDSGRFVVFATKASNLEETSCFGTYYHTYLLDRLDGSYTRLSECHESKPQAKEFAYGISGDGSTVAISTGKISGTVPDQSTLRIYNTATGSSLANASYHRNGEISMTHDGGTFAFISTAFFNSSGVFADNISAFGALMTWNRSSDVSITRANHYFSGLPVSTFHHDEIKISAGGDHVFFAGNSSDFWSTTIDGENSYHESIDNGFTRNYPFVTVRGSHNGWTSFSNARHVGNHLWQAEIVTTVANASFKFDVAGDWSQNYGNANGDNIADYFGGNIVINGGPGVYRVTFNDDTKVYSVANVSVPVLDTHLAPAGVSVAFSCHNGTTTMGQSVYVVGNLPELGNWSAANAVLLNANAYPTWQGNITVPNNTQVEWKCIKRSETNPTQNLVWEGGANNVFNSATSTSTVGQF